MEKISVHLNCPDRFDELLELSRNQGTPERNDLEIITKNDGTNRGLTIVMVTFTVMINGEPVRVQAVTTASLFCSAADAIRASCGS